MGSPRTLQRQSPRVKGGVEFGGGFEASAAKVDVRHEVLCLAGEELVGGSEVPRDATDVCIPIHGDAGDGRSGRVSEGAVEDEVVERVGGPAARTRKLVYGDVGPEPGRVIRGEGVPHRKTEGGGGGVPWVSRNTAARVGVCVGSDGGLPKGVVGAVGGVEKGVLVGPRGGAGGSAAPRFPVRGPKGKGAFTSDGLGVCRRLDPVKGSRPEGQPETRYHNKPMYILQVRVKVVSLRKVSLLALQPLPLLLPAVLLPQLQLL